MHILHYVPRKRTPYIMYTTSREETKYVQLPKAVYEHLKERMVNRVEAMLNYTLSQTGCREAMMLDYFGQHDMEACGHCDLCITERKRHDHKLEDVQEGILYMASLKPRTLKDFVHTLSFPADEVEATVAFVIEPPKEAAPP